MIELEGGDASRGKERLDAGQVLGRSRVVGEVERIDEQVGRVAVRDEPVGDRRGQPLLDGREHRPRALPPRNAGPIPATCCRAPADRNASWSRFP